MHASRSCISRRIRLSSRFRNGMSLVGSEVIPEIVEVGALATLHQRFRRRSVKTEMPYAGVVVDALPTSHARKESIHQHKLRNLRRKLRGVGIGDHQANVVSHYLGFLHAQRLGEIMNADGCA